MQLSLGYREQGIEVSLPLHQLVKAALLGNDAVLQGEEARAAAQDVFVQIVGDDDPGVVLLDAVRVVGKGGETACAVLAGEGLNTLFQQPVKGVFPVLPHRFCAEFGQKNGIQQPGQQPQRKCASCDDQKGAEAVGGFSGDQVRDLLMFFFLLSSIVILQRRFNSEGQSRSRRAS